MRSASFAGLSVRMRLTRGKRMARPDLCRVLLWIESKATRAPGLLDLADRAETLDGVVADPAVDPAQLLVSETEIGLADGKQLTRFVPAAEGVVAVIA